MAAKRPSMRGMGTDAFFGEPQPPQASTPASQHDSIPVSQLVKATFYLTPEQILKLEHLRLARKQRGEKVDKSALVREAIERLEA